MYWSELFSFIAMFLLYIFCGVTVWEFWLLSVMAYYNEENQQRYQKLTNIPLLLFLFFWPISLIWIFKLLFEIHKR